MKRPLARAAGIWAIVAVHALAGCVDPADSLAGATDALSVAPSFADHVSLSAPCRHCTEVLVDWAVDGSLWYTDPGMVGRIAPDGTASTWTATLQEVFPDRFGAIPVEPALAATSHGVVYAFGHHDGQFDVEGSSLIFDHYLAVALYANGHWSIVHEVGPGSTAHGEFYVIDRVLAHSAGDHVVIQWRSNGPNQVTEFIQSNDGGRSFGDIEQLPAGRAGLQSEVMNRLRVGPDGEISYGRTYAVTPRPAANEYYLDERPGLGILDFHVVGEDGPRASILRAGDGPLPTTWGANTAWSDKTGYVFAWQGQDGGVRLMTSPDGRDWTDSTTVVPLPLGTNPWVEIHDGTPTLTVYSRDATANRMQAHFVQWLDAGALVEKLYDGSEFRTEHAGHAIRPDGLAAIPVYDGTSLTFEFRQLQ